MNIIDAAEAGGSFYFPLVVFRKILFNAKKDATFNELMNIGIGSVPPWVHPAQAQAFKNPLKGSVVLRFGIAHLTNNMQYFTRPVINFTYPYLILRPKGIPVSDSNYIF